MVKMILSVAGIASLVAGYVWLTFDILSAWALRKIRATTESLMAKEPPKTLKQDLDSWLSYLGLNFEYTLEIVLAAVLVIGGFFALRRVFICIKYLLLRLRGIRGISHEAMQSGSQFVPSRLPYFQVAVHNMGLFTDTFVGYGFRVNDFLIMPRHVYEEASCDPILVSSRAKFRLTVAPISMTHSDCIAFPIPSSVWADLGISSGSLKPDFDKPMPATCVGKEGMSNGMVYKAAEQVGCLFFTGSTVQGFSGAPLVSNGAVVGMHIGAFGSNNIAVSSVLMAMDLRDLIGLEAKKKTTGGWSIGRTGGDVWLSGGSGNEVPAAAIARGKKHAWTMEEVQNLRASYRAGAPWAEELMKDQAFAEQVGYNSLTWESAVGEKNFSLILSALNQAEKDALMAFLQADKQAASLTKPSAMVNQSSPVKGGLPARVSALEQSVIALTNMVIANRVQVQEKRPVKVPAPKKTAPEAKAVEKSAEAQEIKKKKVSPSTLRYRAKRKEMRRRKFSPEAAGGQADAPKTQVKTDGSKN